MTRAPEIDRRHLRAGMRVAVGVSGGADSVGLLRALVAAAPEIGLVLAVAHVHHGIRGTEADADVKFVENLAQQLGLPFYLHQTDTPHLARENRETLEEAARSVRYAWFRELMAQGKADAVATAHTLDDQAETVLHRLVRGAWTEGLGGIHPVVVCAPGVILRPFLRVRRSEIQQWLRGIGQAWCEDTTNADPAHTRNRIRHELLPQLEGFNPRIAEQLSHLATIARDEETWWEAELKPLLPSLVLPGRAVRGGGRAVSTHPDEGSVGMELERLRELAPAMRRRLLRAAAEHLGCALNFEQTERLMAMCEAEAAKKQQLTAELRAERTVRELRLMRETNASSDAVAAPVEAPVPGEAEGFGVRLFLKLTRGVSQNGFAPALLRTPKPGDRARMRYTRGAKPLKEVFERMNVDADSRKNWPLLEWQGQIVWMKNVAIDPEPPIPFSIEDLQTDCDDQVSD